MNCRHPSSQPNLRGNGSRLPLPLLDCCAGAFIPRGQGVRPNYLSFLVTEISEHLIPGLRLGPFPQLWTTIHSPVDGPYALTSLRTFRAGESSLVHLPMRSLLPALPPHCGRIQIL